jgi:hypothetical protein
VKQSKHVKTRYSRQTQPQQGLKAKKPQTGLCLKMPLGLDAASQIRFFWECFGNALKIAKTLKTQKPALSAESRALLSAQAN